jgi:metal-responsive CopG/Arc/MetJ family transcriptional regulator
MANVKTIAITIDDQTLVRVDRLVGEGGRKNRSLVIRQAVQEYVARLEQAADDAHEAAVVRRHRVRLARQAGALVRRQAKV